MTGQHIVDVGVVANRIVRDPVYGRVSQIEQLALAQWAIDRMAEPAVAPRLALAIGVVAGAQRACAEAVRLKRSGPAIANLRLQLGDAIAALETAFLMETSDGQH